MNAIIVFLDSLWHQMPIPQQNSWHFASSTMPNWRMCGCSHTTTDGQKFHRAFNLPRWLQGGAYTALPPSTAGWLDLQLARYQIFNPLSFPPGNVTITPANPTDTGFFYLRPRNAAPFEVAFGPGPLIIFPGTPAYDQAILVNDGSTLPWCSRTATVPSLPSSSGSVLVEYVP